MRIIAGVHGGLRLNPPAGLPVRPTTDLAKEALFNILQHYVDWEDLECLDLCCGTGNISFELASRGAAQITAVDLHSKCLFYVKEVCQKLGIENIKTRKAEMFKFLNSCHEKYDLIFTDPPYDIGQLPQIPQIVFSQDLLKDGGLLIVEHPSTRKMLDHPNFVESRKYGYSSFSFYRK